MIPLLPTSRDRPCLIPASPDAAAVRPPAVSPGPPYLSFPRPLLPSAWVASAPAAVRLARGHGGHGVPLRVAHGEGARPRPLTVAPARRSRLGAFLLAPAWPPAPASARPGLAGHGALARPPCFGRGTARPRRPQRAPPPPPRPRRGGAARALRAPPAPAPAPVPARRGAPAAMALAALARAAPSRREAPVPGRGAVPCSARRSPPRRGSPPSNLAPARSGRGAPARLAAPARGAARRAPARHGSPAPTAALAYLPWRGSAPALARHGPCVARRVRSSAPACARPVRDASARPCARVLARRARCFGTARRALGALVYP
jgi:hypothetical protein